MRSGEFNRVVVAGVGVVAALLIVVMGIAMVSDIGSTTGDTDSELAAGVDFELDQFDGGRFVLSDYSDRPVFLYFWASWCQPCNDEAPVIQRLWPEYEARGYTFVGVNMWDDDGGDSSRAFVELHGITFPMVIDDGKTGLDYGVSGIPEAFFLKPGLDLDRKYVGPLTEEPLRERLEAIGTS
jgi:cytochrome c biogenesis protein CcmG/thiol:disulfide interchange protein DsbE